MAGAKEDKCIACNQEIEEKDSLISCAECDYPYHIGTCSGVSEDSRVVSRKTWRCQTCKTAKSRGSQSSKQNKDIDVAAMLISMNSKLDTLLNLKETVDAMEESLQHMSANYDQVLKRMCEHDEELKNLKKRVANLEKTEADVEIGRLNQKVNDLEYRSRKQNLEIHGIPKSENEDLMARINEVAGKLDVPVLTADQIIVAHRLGSRPDKIPGIIVRFANQATRDQWLDKRYKLRQARSKIYISESMTQQDKTLLWEVKEWAKEKRYQYVWYKHGKVFVKEKEGAQVRVVRSWDDLERIE